MAKIILNKNFVPASADKKGVYLFDSGDGKPVELIVWLEKSKANDKHPDGKPWIRLPKDNCTNRQYFSEDLFIETQKNGEVDVEIKTAAPRVLGTSGIKQEVIKYLGAIKDGNFIADENLTTEYASLVNGAIDKYKATKDGNKKKKPEEMNVTELEAYIAALKSGTSVAAITGGPKSFLDMFTEAEYNRYNELLALAQANKANAPKIARGPLSEAEKAARRIKRTTNEMTKAEKLLAALKIGGAPVDGDDEFDGDEIIDDEDFIDDEDVNEDEDV